LLTHSLATETFNVDRARAVEKSDISGNGEQRDFWNIKYFFVCVRTVPIYAICYYPQVFSRLIISTFSGTLSYSDSAVRVQLSEFGLSLHR
jgi:hypothetical protein